jgi:chitinase
MVSYQMTFRKICCLLFLLPLCLLGCKVRKTTSVKANSVVYKAPANFRVVGYLLAGDIADGRATGFDLSRVNYLDVFFNGVNASGKLREVLHLDSTIAAAHKLRVIVVGSIGNAVALSLLTPKNRSNFIDSLVGSVVALQLDGIDVDLEGESINKDYDGFVRALSAALKRKGKLLSAAVASWESSKISDKAVSCFDYLNVMSYDATGPWNLKDVGPHSPYSFAVSDIAFWTNKRHVPKKKLNLGLPFYGYGFGPDVKREFHYWEIVKTYPGSELSDSVKLSRGNVIYYNGFETIQKKTKYAMKNAGGVMVWHLMEDAKGDKSLLSVIDKTANTGN